MVLKIDVKWGILIVGALFLVITQLRCTGNRDAVLQLNCIQKMDSLKSVELFALPREISSTGNYNYSLKTFGYFRRSDKVRNGSFYSTSLHVDSIYFNFYKFFPGDSIGRSLLPNPICLKDSLSHNCNVHIVLLFNYSHHTDTVGVSIQRQLVHAGKMGTIENSGETKHFYDNLLVLLPADLNESWTGISDRKE